MRPKFPPSKNPSGRKGHIDQRGRIKLSQRAPAWAVYTQRRPPRVLNDFCMVTGYHISTWTATEEDATMITCAFKCFIPVQFALMILTRAPVSMGPHHSSWPRAHSAPAGLGATPLQSAWAPRCSNWPSSNTTPVSTRATPLQLA